MFPFPSACLERHFNHKFFVAFFLVFVSFVFFFKIDGESNYSPLCFRFMSCRHLDYNCLIAREEWSHSSPSPI